MTILLTKLLPIMTMTALSKLPFLINKLPFSSTIFLNSTHSTFSLQYSTVDCHLKNNKYKFLTQQYFPKLFKKIVKIEFYFSPEIIPAIETVFRRPHNPTIKVRVLAPPTAADKATR